MASRFSKHIRDNIYGLIAVFIALSGTAYAVDGPLAGQNQVGSDDIINGEVRENDLASNAVKSGKVVDESLTAADLAAGAVGSGEVADDSLGATDIATGSVGQLELGSDSVGYFELRTDTFNDEITDTGSQQFGIAPESIDFNEVADNTLTGGQVRDNGLSGSDIAGIGSVDVTDNSLTSSDIADGAVRSAEIADNNVAGADVNESTLGPSTDVEINHTGSNLAQHVLPEATATIATYDRPEVDGNYLILGHAQIGSWDGDLTHASCWLTKNGAWIGGLKNGFEPIDGDRTAYTIPMLGSTTAVAGDEIAVTCRESGDGEAVIQTAGIAIIAVDAVG